MVRPGKSRLNDYAACLAGDDDEVVSLVSGDVLVQDNGRSSSDNNQGDIQQVSPAGHPVSIRPISDPIVNAITLAARGGEY